MAFYITIDDCDIKTLQTINRLYKSDNNMYFYTNVKVNCIYHMFPHILLKNTSLSKDMINMICEYINESILVSIAINSDRSLRSISIYIDNALTNFIDWYAKIWYIGGFIYELSIRISNKIVQISGDINVFQDEVYVYKIIQQIINDSVNFRIPNNKYVYNEYRNKHIVKYKIVNYDILLLVCNILYTFGKYIDKFRFNTKKLIC